MGISMLAVLKINKNNILCAHQIYQAKNSAYSMRISFGLPGLMGERVYGSLNKMYSKTTPQETLYNDLTYQIFKIFKINNKFSKFTNKANL